MVFGNKKISNSKIFENSESSKKSQSLEISYNRKEFEVKRNSRILKLLENSESEDSGEPIDLTGDSEIQKPSNYSIPKIAMMNFKKSSRRKNSLKNALNNNSSHRSCPPRTRAQQGKLGYHNGISLNFENKGNNNFEPIWHPIALKCHVCNIECNK